jgi:hypothetical protein
MPEEVLVTANPTAIHRPADYRVYYSNLSRLRLTNADIQIFFGLAIDSPPGTATIVNEEALSVVLTPVNAKLLLLALSSALAAYEVQFGPIPIPQDAAQKAEEIRKAVLEAAQRLAKPKE